MKIGLDIDGVISDFVAIFTKIIYDEYDIFITEDQIIYHDLNLVLGIPQEETNRLIHQTLQEDIPLIEGAKEAIDELSKEHLIYLVSARPIDRKITLDWLERKEIKYNELIFLEEGKKYQCNIDLDVFIDDNLKEIIKFIGKIKYLIIYDHPWNRCLNIKNKFQRVKNWKDILHYIKKLKKK